MAGGTRTDRDIALFIHHAGTVIKRWQALVGCEVMHATLGSGTVVGVEPGASGTRVQIGFVGDSVAHRTFSDHQLADEAFFLSVAIALDDEERRQIRSQVADAERRRTESAMREQGHIVVRQRRATVVRDAVRRPSVPLAARRDVLSVPAGDTAHYIAAHDVHAHPVSYAYRPTQYITFRQSGGIMWKIYDLGRAHIFDLNPHEPVQVRERLIAALPLAEVDRQRVRDYFAERMRDGLFEKEYSEPFTFYVLPTDDNIDLPHRPHPGLIPIMIWTSLCGGVRSFAR